MSNNNEILKNRFMDRHIKLSKAIPIILDCIALLENINLETDYAETIQNFISNLANHDLNDEKLNQVKQVLNEFVSNQLTKNEALASLNHIHDVTYFEATNMLLIQDVFKCYF